MKTDLFKKLIKEAVREVIREELPLLLERSEKPIPAFSSTFVPTKRDAPKLPFTLPQPPGARPISNPILEMLTQTQQSMTRDELKNIVGSTQGFAPAGIQEEVYESFQPGPEPGINLAALDFVKGAAAKFKLMEQKTQERNGISN